MTRQPTHNPQSEQALIDRIARGDKEAFRNLFERHQLPIFRYCMLMTGDEASANDVYQDTFFTLYRVCREGKKLRNVRGYLIAVARSRCLDHLELDRRHVSLDHRPEPTWEPDVTAGETKEILRRALLWLPEQYREAFVLFAIKDFSYEEIAVALDVSRHVVKNRIFRAKQSMQKILGPMLRDTEPGDGS